MSFADALQRHQRWISNNLPGIDTQPGIALLIWLLKYEGHGEPIGRLYRESRSSEPTMRACVKAFTDHGLAVIEVDGNDSRLRLIRGTKKLQRQAEELRRRLGELSLQTRPLSDG
jgi:hypothetical protein